MEASREILTSVWRRRRVYAMVYKCTHVLVVIHSAYVVEKYLIGFLMLVSRFNRVTKSYISSDVLSLPGVFVHSLFAWLGENAFLNLLDEKNRF